MPRIFSYLALAIFFASPAWAETQGTFTAFRWNQGYRAEREPLLEQSMTEAEFREVVNQGKLPSSEQIYRGCYLVHYQPERAARKIASVAKPVAETYRVCLPRQNLTPTASPLSTKQ
jgi:hypothetical protein